jgi:hypothetical protein
MCQNPPESARIWQNLAETSGHLAHTTAFKKSPHTRKIAGGTPFEPKTQFLSYLMTTLPLPGVELDEHAVLFDTLPHFPPGTQFYAVRRGHMPGIYLSP